jgi:uncharacterized protein YjiS (DUF1127 family)
MTIRLSLDSNERLQADLPAILSGPASVLSRLKGLRGLAAKWRKRVYFRKELKSLARDVPHLIDDIGLTMRQAESEIEKPFWRA